MTKMGVDPPDEDTSGEITAAPQQRQASIPLAERPYLKRLVVVWNTSRAGQSFVASLPKQAKTSREDEEQLAEG